MSRIGKLVRLADHPRFRTRKKDPELVMVGPGEYLTREEYNDLLPPDQDYEEIDWENEGILLAVCGDCSHSEDTRPWWRKLLGHPPQLVDQRCALKDNARCDVVNGDGTCDDFDIVIHYG